MADSIFCSLHTSKYDGVILGLVLAYSALRLEPLLSQSAPGILNDGSEIQLGNQGLLAGMNDNRRQASFKTQDSESTRCKICFVGCKSGRIASCFCLSKGSKAEKKTSDQQPGSVRNLASRSTGDLNINAQRDDLDALPTGWLNGLDIDLRGIEFSPEVRSVSTL